MRLVLLWAVVPFLAAPGLGQGADIPRTAEGRPDFHGVWESRWRTPLERQDEAAGPVVSAEQADALVNAQEARAAAQGSLNPESDFDWGPFMPARGGGFRTSLIVDPADGKLPLTPDAREWGKAQKDMRDRSEGPEARNLWERCIRGPGHPPLGITPGNMNRLIVQTGDHLVIITEDMAEARIIEFAGRPRPAGLASYMGESVARWEGDGLVVETRLLRADPAAPPSAAGRAPRRITETLRFNSRDELAYSYVIDDPAVFTAPVRVEYVLLRTTSRMFEASCHEGNYSLANILSGARVAEARARSSAK